MGNGDYSERIQRVGGRGSLRACWCRWSYGENWAGPRSPNTRGRLTLPQVRALGTHIVWRNLQCLHLLASPPLLQMVVAVQPRNRSFWLHLMFLGECVKGCHGQWTWAVGCDSRRPWCAPRGNAKGLVEMKVRSRWWAGWMSIVCRRNTLRSRLWWCYREAERGDIQSR